ncbi:NUDIX domain-containing protein [Kitasatospora hibisci]|uniref:NUDIX domain-containing protein n=1 Tax=Kitasatospora hibisci TaxID=3369522 RepID=UPI0037542B06
MPRRDYEDGPNAPKANCLVPAAGVVVVDDAGRVLLQRRTDNGMWALPGGRMDLGESPAGCGIRETREETGLDIEITGIVGTHTNPGHVFAYDDGEVRQEFSVRLLGRPIGGGLQVSDESREVAWFSPAQTDELPMVPSTRKRLADWRGGVIPVVR